MRNHAGAEGSERGCIVVEWARIELPRRHTWVDGGVAEEVERHLGLRDEKIPQVLGKVGIGTCKDRDKVSLEGSDGAFSCIASVHVGRYQLKLGSPSLGDLALVFFACFVVEYLQVDMEVTEFELSHDVGVGLKAMGICTSLEGASEDYVSITVICNHDVLVAAAAADGKAASVISIHPADVLHTDV